MLNLSAFVQAHAVRTPDRLAVVYQDQRVTWADFEDRVLRLAGWLAAQGVTEDDIVAVVMKNSTTFLEAAFAVSHLGAVFLPVNYRLAQPEVGYIAGHAGAKLLLADAEFADIAAGTAPAVHLLDEAGQRDSRSFAGGSGAAPPAPRKTDDLYRLMYTSGTTDRPKGVMHSYGNFYWKCMDQVIALAMTAADRLLIVGPLYHVGACDLPGIAALWIGGSIVVMRDFDAAAALAAIERERVTCAWFAPVMTGRLLALEDRERFDRTSLAWAIGGGERTPESRIRAFRDLFPNARYIDGFGLTETCGGDTLMEAGMEIAKIGSTGRALAHVEIRIADDTGNWLPPDREGEICVRGPKVTAGYWKDAAKTAASFFGEWFRTGDMGRLDADGFLYVTDRKKDMIISGGENIASSEVERVLYELPEIAEAAVIGVPDESWGERPIAVAVLRPGAALDYAAVAAHCRDRLAGFKVPKELHLRDDLPRNPSGKILKRVLREEFARAG